jgi:hypothetical protein
MSTQSEEGIAPNETVLNIIEELEELKADARKRAESTLREVIKISGECAGMTDEERETHIQETSDHLASEHRAMLDEHIAGMRKLI